VGRSLLAVVCVIALVPALLAADVAVWLSRAVLDGPAFTATVDRALDDPVVVEALEDQSTDVVVEAIERLDPLVRGVVFVALGLPAEPSAAQVEALARERVSAVLETSLVREARTAAVLDLHALLTGGVADRSRLLVVEPDLLLLDVRPVVERALATIDPRLADAGLAVLPADATRLALVRLDGLATVRTGLERVEGTVPVLIAIVVLLVLLALVLARDRPGMLGWIGLAVAVAGALGIITAWLAGDPIARGIEDELVRTAVRRAYPALTEPLLQQSVGLLVVGILLAAGGWLGGVARRRQRGTA
jgi:hypothetical protein